MPNIFAATGLTALADAYVAFLSDAGVVINTLWRDFDSALEAGRGDTITVRAPQVIPATNFTGTATPTNVNEGKLTINLNQQPYSQVLLSTKERSFAVEDLAVQVISPQVAGIAEYIDSAAADLLAGTGGTATGTTWREGVANAYGVLTGNGVPLSDRWLGVAPDVASSLLNDTIFVSAADRGDGGAALNDAVLGSLYGFQVYTSSQFAAGTAVAYHRTAVAVAFRTPTPPEGGAKVGNASYKGVSGQVIYAYDPSKLSDVITVHSLFGGDTGTDLDERAVLVSVTP